MIMTALNRKLLRELWTLKSQMFSIALVVAVGIMSIVTMGGSYESLVRAQENYYRQSRFADVWISLVRAPLSLAEELVAIPGVDAVDTRITFLATLDLDDSGNPAYGRFVSLPEFGRPVLNDLTLVRGRYIDAGSNEEIVISENFALARDFDPGDSLRAIINGRAREFQIVGVANSPEHIYAVPPGSLLPEDARYGVIWASRAVLGPAFNMDGAFNEASLSLTADANASAVIERVDYIVTPFGGLGAYPRSDQPSHLILESELEQNRVSGIVVPLIFLGVAVFLLYLVLGRLITTQRGEIAVLKAFGYSDVEVGRHFLMFAVVAVLIGGAIGTVGGFFLGDAYIGVYQRYFNLPGLEFISSSRLLLFAFLACIAGAFAGAIAAVLKAVRLPPAEAMRPEAPVTFKPGLFERLGLSDLLGPQGSMVLRNVERKPVQGFFSTLGIAMAVAILTIGFFMFDSVYALMDIQFRQVQREDINVTFREILPYSVRHELAAIDGVHRVEAMRAIPARLRAGHRHDEVVIQGFDPDGQLRRVIDASGNVVSIPASGLVLSRLLAERLGLQTGDEVGVEFLEGKQAQGVTAVSAIIDDYLGLSVIMNRDALWRLSGEQQVINGAFLAIDDRAHSAINRQLKRIPAVTGVTSPEAMLQSFEEQLADSLLVSSGFLLGFAGVIAVGVIYNAARIALSERGRELASLRVMGFHRREVATLLLGEQALLTILAIPLGWGIGMLVCYALTVGMQTDLYRIPFVTDPRTFIGSGLVVVAAAYLSGRVVRRRLDRANLVEVLKTRE